MNCNYCGKQGATKELKNVGYESSQWFHQSCYDTMPANCIFPSEFRKKDRSAQAKLDYQTNKRVKDGKFI